MILRIIKIKNRKYYILQVLQIGVNDKINKIAWMGISKTNKSKSLIFDLKSQIKYCAFETLIEVRLFEQVIANRFSKFPVKEDDPEKIETLEFVDLFNQ